MEYAQPRIYPCDFEIQTDTGLTTRLSDSKQKKKTAE